MVLLRRVDDNWYEGRIGNRQGIFPISYIEITREPSTPLITPAPSVITTPMTGEGPDGNGGLVRGQTVACLLWQLGVGSVEGRKTFEWYLIQVLLCLLSFKTASHGQTVSN